MHQNEYIRNNIARVSSGTYTSELVNKYFIVQSINYTKILRSYDDCPIWVLLELLSFGELVSLYKYYFDTTGLNSKVEISLLHSIKSLRNGCAHNNCMLMDLNERGTRHPNRTQPNSVISQEVSQISTISRDQRRKRLSNRAVYELTCLLSVYKTIVNDTTKTHRILD